MTKKPFILKNKYFLAAIPVLAVFFLAGPIFAQNNDHTVAAEAEGKIIWDKLQSQTVKCGDLTDKDFELLGEYFMGQMTGNAHASMNQMMVSMMGEEGEEQMHAVMGKRLSGCDTSAAYSFGGSNFMPMMGMMNMMGGYGNWSNFSGSNNFTNNMMGFGFGPSFIFLGWLFAILWHILIILAIVALIRWIVRQFKDGGKEKSTAMEVLKERYAKGEINKQEFEDKKKDLM